MITLCDYSYFKFQRHVCLIYLWLYMTSATHVLILNSIYMLDHLNIFLIWVIIRYCKRRTFFVIPYKKKFNKQKQIQKNIDFANKQENKNTTWNCNWENQLTCTYYNYCLFRQHLILKTLFLECLHFLHVFCRQIKGYRHSRNTPYIGKLFHIIAGKVYRIFFFIFVFSWIPITWFFKTDLILLQQLLNSEHTTFSDKDSQKFYRLTIYIWYDILSRKLNQFNVKTFFR